MTVLFLVFCSSLCCSMGIAAEPPSLGGGKPTPQQVKAAFIYNILQLVSLPVRSGQEFDPYLNFFILGEDPIDKAFEPYQGEKINGRILRIRHIRPGQNLKEAHILFISSSESSRIGPIVRQAQMLGQLTIGDTEGFGRQGVMINFYEEKNKIRFEINLESVRAGGVIMSSHLLKLARIVKMTQ